MWNTAVSRQRLSAFAILLTLSGCTALSDCKYELGQKIRTKQAWHEFDGCHPECFTIDYSNGWKAGYYDVATGGKGCPPVVAPKEYWKPPVFCEYDPSRRDDWYCGFLDGAACAKCEPNHHYLQTYLPGPACCPVQAVCCPEVIEGPEIFPMEQIHGDAVLDELEGPPMDADSQLPGDAAPMPAIEPAKDQPSAAPAPGQQSPSEDYEKDPATPSPQADSSGTTPLLQRLIQQSQQQQANAVRKSLIERLVLNVAQPNVDHGF